MFAVAVNHLLDVVVVMFVVIAAVSDVLPVVDPVATVGNGAGDWRDGLSLPADSCRYQRDPGNYAVARAVGPEPVEDWLGKSGDGSTGSPPGDFPKFAIVPSERVDSPGGP